MKADRKQEYTRRISQANTTDMVVIIYDIALDYIAEAKETIENSQKELLNQKIVSIRKCINELIGSLNYDYPPAGELLELYVYCSRLLVLVQQKKEIKDLDQIEYILSRLRDAFAQIADTNKTGPIMENSQSVYAGLTYGKSSLNELVTDSGNRGFLA